MLGSYEFEAEIEMTNRILSSENVQCLYDALVFLNSKVYEDLINMEIKKLINSCTWLTKDTSLLRFVFFGSGPLPASALLIHKLTGANVICVDINARAVDLSSKLMIKIGLEDKIIIVQSSLDGSNVEIMENDIIWLANMVGAKKEVLSSIVNKLKQGVVAIRSTEGLKALRYDSLDDNIISELNLKLVGLKCPIGDTTQSSTLFYTVKK